jgi:CheY-like chemotaxis protein
MAVSVLVVDDDAGFRSLAVGVLRAAGYDRVHEAGSAVDALIEVVRVRPDVVLVDVGLPDRDGFVLAGELARLAAPPRVVLISADADAGDDDAARSVGAVGFFLKEELAGARLHELISRP